MLQLIAAPTATFAPPTGRTYSAQLSPVTFAPSLQPTFAGLQGCGCNGGARYGLSDAAPLAPPTPNIGGDPSTWGPSNQPTPYAKYVVSAFVGAAAAFLWKKR